ncbi:acyl-CoA thioesterase [Pseudoalteromonas sp. Cnat2-41]|uniref:acyl-CoA thioesterase n=1 Tax=unclassified Pseudoalteromonas TaxID=194690 RepID=UPI001EF7B565|nr:MULTISPECIES: acyl-CoA thioesterase [unclassified Pseudoalteromonas]MCF2862087.1 acyl-CoA thioesterase [Pseudoalteromonas sp. CNAT2-18]MCG7558144.1 acyl-CoA thioesterase [Pseudoalteromonas sp. CNAT2-18.1]
MTFRIDMKVRDYECDIQGIVNNSVYFNYLEHARHEFLLAQGVDFAALARDKINLVVLRSELDYKASLTPGDHFYVTVEVVRESRLKFAFVQNVYRSADDKVALQAKVIGTAVNAKGRPFVAKELETLIA